MEQRESNETTQKNPASLFISPSIGTVEDLFNFDWSPFLVGPSVGASNHALSSANINLLDVPYPQVTWVVDDALPPEFTEFDWERHAGYTTGVHSTLPISLASANGYESNFVFDRGYSYPNLDFDPSDTTNLGLLTSNVIPAGSASAEGFHDHVPLIDSSFGNEVNGTFPFGDDLAFLAHSSQLNSAPFNYPTYAAPQFLSPDATDPYSQGLQSSNSNGIHLDSQYPQFSSSDGTYSDSQEMTVSTKPDHGAKIFPCSELGCNKQYRRLPDLARHMKVHFDAKCPCPVDHCKRGYHRLDKLRDHLRGGHKLDEEIVVRLAEEWKARYEHRVRAGTRTLPVM